MRSEVAGIGSSQDVAGATRRRRDVAWACASLLVLIVSWDAAMRLDEKVPLPRPRVVQEMELQRAEGQ